MDAKQLDVKVYAKPSDVRLEELIPVFHGWIQNKRIEDELLIDVADYAHVVDGPGVLLVGHEAHYYLDETKGQRGLLYSLRRGAQQADFRGKLQYALRHALQASEMLEGEEALNGRLRFDGGALQLRINDRLRAPNTDETFAAIRGDVEAVLRDVYGDVPFELMREGEPRELFQLRVQAKGAPDIGTLHTRLRPS